MKKFIVGTIGLVSCVCGCYSVYTDTPTGITISGLLVLILFVGFYEKES